MSQEQKAYQRKEYLVDRDYQLRFVTRLFIVICGIAVASSVIATGILWKNMYRPELDQQTHIVSALIGVAVILLIELLVAIPIVYYLGVRQSHQVVGPVKRMVKTLEALGSGDLTQRIVVRRGDVLEDVAQAINQMADSLQKRVPAPPRS